LGDPAGRRSAEDRDCPRPCPAHARQVGQGTFTDDVKPLYPSNYVLIGEWTPTTHPDGIAIDDPFLIRIPWSELEY
jgi:hypothetical protein